MTWIAYIGVDEDDENGFPVWTDGDYEADAIACISAHVELPERVLRVERLDTMLNGIRGLVAAGHNVVCSHKSEDGDSGPVTFVDRTQADDDPNVGPIGMPYGYSPDWQFRLPWSKPGAARAFAKRAGISDVTFS
jgi:hypothetical protein